jgi:hypothetical protein
LPDPNPTSAKSVRELAKAVGRSHTAVAKWVNDDRWPFGKSPWDVAAVKAWAAETLAPNPADDPARVSTQTGANSKAQMGPERRAKLAVLSERAALLKFRRETEQGQHHRADVCLTRRVTQVRELRIRLTSLADSLPFDATEKDLVRARVLEMLQGFAMGAPRV